LEGLGCEDSEAEADPKSCSTCLTASKFWTVGWQNTTTLAHSLYHETLGTQFLFLRYKVYTKSELMVYGFNFPHQIEKGVDPLKLVKVRMITEFLLSVLAPCEQLKINT
jgi:hypothetical protein